jgi:hypothetical protein
MGEAQDDLAVALYPSAIHRHTSSYRRAECTGEIALFEGEGSALWCLRFKMILRYGFVSYY